MSPFESPNFTQTPNDLFDKLLPDMGLAELKVVMCIVRHTFGYHKDEVRLSIRLIARATGLTVNSVMEGANQAEDHGLITRYQDGNKTTLWRANVSVVPTKTHKRRVSPTKTPRLSSRDAGVSPTATQVGVKERNKPEKKGDLVDAMLFFGKQAQDQQADKVEDVIQRLERDLHVNIARSLTNQQVAKRILEDGRSIDKWISWVNAEEWRAAHTYLYADMERVWRDWPQAFVKQTDEDRPEYKIFRAAEVDAGKKYVPPPGPKLQLRKPAKQNNE